MNISIIGAGRVGQTLGFLARKHGHKINEVVCRSIRSARAATKFIGAGTPLVASRARISSADMILISTPDDSIEGAVEIIERQAGEVRRAVAFHTSGVKPSSTLHSLSRLGMSIASCHPLQTFASPERAIDLISKTWFCIEGEARAVRAARRLVRDIGAQHFEIDTEMKSLYHAAAVMASGGVTALLSISLEMMEQVGLSQLKARQALSPLVEATVANTRDVGPARAITGPVRRGDAGTVNLNMNAIAALDAEWLELYRALARRSLLLAERAGTNPQALAKLHLLLKRK